MSARAARLAALFLLTGCAARGLAGCGKPPPCATPDETVQVGEQAVTCASLEPVARHVSDLAARPLTKAERQRLAEALVQDAHGDPAAVHAVVGASEAAVDAALSQDALTRAKARATTIYGLSAGQGPFATDSALARAARRIVAPWVTSADDALALSEQDVEGWIRYASLSREIQGAPPLSLSVADRVGVYRTVSARFEAGPTEVRVAMAWLGQRWPDIADRWQALSYTGQRAFIDAAPFPAPMTGTSGDYVAAVMAEDPRLIVAALRAHVLPPSELQAPSVPGPGSAEAASQPPPAGTAAAPGPAAPDEGADAEAPPPAPPP